ncbi:hypothetical protein [Halobacillus salinus]|uniref:hypothetical protein n=1 Tax=Halobacillus salinus TaxID=192814 RepID=UPI0009A81981|nr:hypothetical protein [Halobacillus salinus]
MKWVKLAVLGCFLVVGIYGCDASQGAEEGMEDQEAVAQEAEESDDGNSNSFSLGSFETIKENKDLGTYELGPLSIEMKGVYLQEGTLNEGLPRERYGKEVELVVLMMRTNAEHTDLEFANEHFSIKVGNEKVDEPSVLLSSAIYPLALEMEDRPAQMTFVLEETEVKSVEEVQLTIAPPISEAGEPLGEEITKTITFD